MRNLPRGSLKTWLQTMWFNPAKFYENLINLKNYFKDISTYKKLSALVPFKFSWAHIFPVIDEKTEIAGYLDGHYFMQDILVAKDIYHANPDKHIDIGSRIDGFIAHLLTFREVSVIDIRPLPYHIPGLNFICDDATKLTQFKDNSVESLSCLHAIEHFGLGRYGDPIDPKAPWDFAQSLSRVLAPGGKLYLSTPVGRETLYFNAHRVFDPQTVINMFDGLRLLDFRVIAPQFQVVAQPDHDFVRQHEYLCGIFTFTKE